MCYAEEGVASTCCRGLHKTCMYKHLHTWACSEKKLSYNLPSAVSGSVARSHSDQTASLWFFRALGTDSKNSENTKGSSKHCCPDRTSLKHQPVPCEQTSRGFFFLYPLVTVVCSHVKALCLWVCVCGTGRLLSRERMQPFYETLT